MAKPKITSAAEWQRERDELLKAEKEATRARDALAAVAVALGAKGTDAEGGGDPLLAARALLGAWDWQGVESRINAARKREVVRCIGTSGGRMGL